MADLDPELTALFLADQRDADVELTEDFVRVVDEINQVAAEVGAPPVFFLSEDRKSARMHPDLYNLLKEGGV